MQRGCTVKLLSQEGIDVQQCGNWWESLFAIAMREIHDNMKEKEG
jgi:hypothetical protein